MISAGSPTKYASVESSDKVARKLGILAVGERQDMKVWMNDLEASLNEFQTGKLREVKTSCQLSRRVLSTTCEHKKGYHTY